MTTEKLLEKYDTATRNAGSERALWNLLKANEKHIEGLIEADPTGHSFHKSFRQVDITGSAHVDMAIWLLLSEATLFWDVLGEN